MTILKLSRALLLTPDYEVHPQPWEMPALKELHLEEMQLNNFWLDFIATDLPTLTQLTVASCWLEEDEEVDYIDFTVADTVR